MQVEEHHIIEVEIKPEELLELAHKGITAALNQYANQTPGSFGIDYTGNQKLKFIIESNNPNLEWLAKAEKFLENHISLIK